MNYNEFMKAVEEKLSIMSEEEKTKWIHNVARTTKEHERTKLLNSLYDKQDYKSVIYEEDKIEEWCEKIEEGEIYFECSGHEEYGESYWDNNYVYDYYDPFDIADNLYKAFQVAEDLLFQKRYEESLTLNSRLLNLIFFVSDRDTGVCNELEFGEIIDEILTTFNCKRIVLNSMYATYQISRGKKRTESLYSYLVWNKCKDIRIEEIFNIGPEELKNIDHFVEEWISFLGDADGDRAGVLLLEACLYRGGIDCLCEVARTRYLKHPVLFKYACRYLLDENEDLRCEELGLEAIRVLSENLIIRGEIADLIAQAATNLKHYDIIYKSYEAAFYSKSTLDHYLRLFDLPDYEIIVKKATKHIETLPEDTITHCSSRNKQMTVNSLSRNNKDVIKFFNGEFDYIYDKCKSDKSALGWSTGFKGVTVPLFIMLLYNDEKFTKAMQKLVNMIMYRLEKEFQKRGDSKNRGA